MSLDNQPHSHQVSGSRAGDEYLITYGHLTKVVGRSTFREANGWSPKRIEKLARKLIKKHDRECRNTDKPQEEYGKERKNLFLKLNAALTTTSGAWGSKILEQGLTEDL